MKGNKKGVFKHPKDMIPILLDLGRCSLHHVLNAMQASVKEMPREVDFANNVYYYFENSSRCSTDYKEVQKEGNLPPLDKTNDFLRPVAPHFLWLKKCSDSVDQNDEMLTQMQSELI